MLPKIINGSCEVCGGSSSIPADQIVWVNEGPGIPYSWSLLAAKPDSPYRKWGRPYDHEAECPECGARSVVSTHFVRFKITSCSECGVLQKWTKWPYVRDASKANDLMAKAVRVIVTNVLLKTEGGDWDSYTHKAARYLLNKVGHTEVQAGKIDPDKVNFRMLRSEMSKQGVSFDTEEAFGEFLESFRAYALIELTLNDKTPLQERLDFK
jgi:ribosomal protein S27AE